MRPGIVQRIFNDHYAQVDATHRLDMRARTAAWDIRTCRTFEQGYHIDACPNDDYSIVLTNSCGHRCCPMCGATETELWIERQRAKEIRCPHHQVVVTSPGDLRPLWRWNRKLFTNLYFRAAWHSLRELLADIKHLGALPGVIAVFQSWKKRPIPTVVQTLNRRGVPIRGNPAHFMRPERCSQPTISPLKRQILAAASILCQYHPQESCSEKHTNK